MVQAFKIAVASRTEGIDDLLRPLLLDFFKLISDPDLNVRRIALVSFNSAVHNKPHLVKPILAHVLPLLYHETNVRQEHVRKVQLGLFSEIFDDGLDARKTAFECLFTVRVVSCRVVLCSIVSCRTLVVSHISESEDVQSRKTTMYHFSRIDLTVVYRLRTHSLTHVRSLARTFAFMHAFAHPFTGDDHEQVLERCYDFVIIPEFVQQVSKGLADQHDIQVK
jgi:hypothetical protein